MIGFVFTGDLFNMYVMLEIMTFAAISLTAFRNYKDKAVEAAFKYIVNRITRFIFNFTWNLFNL